VSRQERISAREYRRISGDSSAALAVFCQMDGLPEPVLEYRFAPPRRWRFDLAWPSLMLAAEIDGGRWVGGRGGRWVGGRHTSGTGFAKDCEKMTEAAVLGWRVLRLLPEWVASGKALGYVRSAIGGHND